MAKLSQAQVDFANEFSSQTTAPAAPAAPAAATPAAVATNNTYATNPNTGYVEGGSQPAVSATNPASASAAGIAAENAQLQSLVKGLQTPQQVATAIGGTVVNGQVVAPPSGNTSGGSSGTLTPGTAQTDATLAFMQQLSQGITGLPADFGSLVATLYKNVSTDPSVIAQLLQNPSGYTSNDPTVTAALQAASSAWQTRFAGNTARQAAGLNPLTVSQYISAEQAYKQVAARAGLPASFMTTDYLGKLIAADVAPNEMNDRVNAAMTAITNTDPFVTQQLQQNFGLTTGDMVAHLLDPATSAEVIQQKVNASQLQGEAGRENLALNQQNAMTLAAQGVSQAQAQAAYQNIGTQIGQTQTLANMYGMQPSQVGNELLAAQTGANINGMTAAQATLNLQRLQQQEVNQFSGSSGASKGSLYSEQEGVS